MGICGPNKSKAKQEDDKSISALLDKIDVMPAKIGINDGLAINDFKCLQKFLGIYILF